MGTARMKEDKETEGEQKRVKMKIKWARIKKVRKAQQQLGPTVPPESLIPEAVDELNN